MPKIRQDQFGLFVAAGGYRARPVDPTVFAVGDVIKTHHFGGSVFAGIGKLPERGKYLETWVTCGESSDVCGTISKRVFSSSSLAASDEEGKILWYKDHVAHHFKTKLTAKQKQIAQEWFNRQCAKLRAKL